MSMDDEEKSQTEDDLIRDSVEDLRGALSKYLLINLVASETRRQQILEEFTIRCRDSIEVQRVDGLMYDYGDLVDVLRKFSQSKSRKAETEICIHRAGGL